MKTIYLSWEIDVLVSEASEDGCAFTSKEKSYTQPFNVKQKNSN